MQMSSIDSSCELEGLVIIVKIILKFSGEQDGGQYYFVNIEVIESKLAHFKIVPIDVDDSDNEAFRGEFGILMQTFEEIME